MRKKRRKEGEFAAVIFLINAGMRFEVFLSIIVDKTNIFEVNNPNVARHETNKVILIITVKAICIFNLYFISIVILHVDVDVLLFFNSHSMYVSTSE